jgi:hypothetical protein
MIYSFSVVVERGGHVSALEDCATSEAEIRERYRAAGIMVISATQVHPVIDWSRGTFDAFEAAEFLRKGRRYINDKLAEGKLPKSSGHPVFTRRQLERLIEEGTS